MRTRLAPTMSTSTQWLAILGLRSQPMTKTPYESSSEKIQVVENRAVLRKNRRGRPNRATVPDHPGPSPQAGSIRRGRGVRQISPSTAP